jgi:hypothetical protein
LRQADGKAAIIAPRAIEGWLSPTGTYWRLFHIAKREKMLDEFFRFHGFLFERYARHLAYVAHPGQRRRRPLGTAGIVHGDFRTNTRASRRRPTSRSSSAPTSSSSR